MYTRLVNREAFRLTRSGTSTPKWTYSSRFDTLSKNCCAHMRLEGGLFPSSSLGGSISQQCWPSSSQRITGLSGISLSLVCCTTFRRKESALLIASASQTGSSRLKAGSSDSSVHVFGDEPVCQDRYLPATHRIHQCFAHRIDTEVTYRSGHVS